MATREEKLDKKIDRLMDRLPKYVTEEEREQYEEWLRRSALARGAESFSIFTDDFISSAVGAVLGPKVQQWVQSRHGDPSGLPAIAGTLAGTAGQVALAGGVLRALAPMVQGAAAAGRIPQLTRAVEGVRKASPLAQEVLRDMAIGPMVEAMRASVGHDVTMKDFLRSTAITGGAGLGAIAGRSFGQGLSRAGTRALMAGGATAGGLAASVPFAEEGSGTEAILTGLAMGLLYPAQGRATISLPRQGASIEPPPTSSVKPTTPVPRAPVPTAEGYISVPVRPPSAQAVEMPTEALEFINSRRSPQRKQFAQKYAEWLAGGEAGNLPEPDGITSRAANDIRERIDAAFNNVEGPTQLPLPVQLDAVTPPAAGQSGGVRLRASTPPPEMPIVVDPPRAEVIAQQGGAAATIDAVTGQGGVTLYRPVHEVVGEIQSIPRNEFYKLPRAVRAQLSEIDEQVKNLNAEAQKILRRNNVKDPLNLPPNAQAQYAEVMEQLRDMDGRRNTLRPTVIAGLEKRGALGRVIVDRIDEETAAAIVPIEGPRQTPSHIQYMHTKQPWETEVHTRDVLEQLDPEELRLRDANVFHNQEDATLGFLTEIQPDSSIEAMSTFRTTDFRHLDLMEPPVDVLDTMRSRTPNWFNKIFTTMRDMFGEDIAKQVRDAKHTEHVFVRQWSKVLDDILKPFKGGRGLESRVRIAKLLDGTPVDGVTAGERMAAQQLRERFFNPLFKEFGIDPQRFLEDYLPRLREGYDLSKEMPAEQWAKIKFFAEEVRTALDASDPRQWDVLDITIRYLRSGAKAKFLEPARLAVEPAVANMDPHRRAMFEIWFGQLMGRRTMDEAWLDSTLDKYVGSVVRAFGGKFSERPSQELSLATTHLVHLGTIAYNAFSVVKNLTQQIHTMAQVGVKDWARAHRALRTQSGKELLKYNWVGQHRVYLEGMELQRTLFDRILGPVSEVGFKGYQWADLQNVNTAYMAAVLKDLDAGKSLAHAVNTGNYTAMLTQFGYGVDAPAMFRTPVGRLIGALQSYPVNFARMLYAQGSTGHKAEAIKTVVGLAVGKWALEKITKMDFSSITPWETLKGYPAWALTTGDFSPPVETGVALVEGVGKWADQFIRRDSSAVDPPFERLKESMRVYVPGNLQYRRIANFIDRVRDDWKELDDQGRPVYNISKGEAVRAVFGPTKEADIRFNIRRRYENALMQDVDPEIFGLPAQAINAAESLLVGDAAYRRKLLRQQADRVGMSGEELHKQSLSRVRQYYLGDGKNGFWPAVYKGDTREAERLSEVLKRLETTTPMLISSGESRGVAAHIVRNGINIFGYVGMPRTNIPVPTVSRSNVLIPSVSPSRIPVPSVSSRP